jgi:hypothetical protein
MVKQGGTVIFNKRVDEVPFILKDLKEGESYTLHLSVCTKKSNCKSTNSTGMELRTLPLPAPSGKEYLTCIYYSGCTQVLKR